MIKSYTLRKWHQHMIMNVRNCNKQGGRRGRHGGSAPLADSESGQRNLGGGARACRASGRGRMARDAASLVPVVQRASESLSVSLRSRRAVVVRRARVKWCLRDEAVAGATVAGCGGGLRPRPWLHPSHGHAPHHAVGLRPAWPQL